MKAKEVAKLLANRVNQEHYILELMTKLYKVAYEKGKSEALNMRGVGKSVKEKYTPTFEEWIKTFKQVDGKLYQLDNYRTYCIAAMHQEYRLTFKVEP